MSFQLFSKLYGAPELLAPNSKPVGDVKLKSPDDFHGYWLLRDLALTDSSPYKLDGVLQGAATLGEGALGKEAVFVNATGNRINIGAVDLSGLTQFTVTVLAKTDGSGTDEQTFISNWENAATSGSILFRLDPSASNQLEGFVVVEPNTQIGANFTDLNMTSNKYHYCTLRFNSLDGSGLSCFLDGKKSSITAATSAALDATTTINSLYIGDSPHGTSDSYGGSIVCVQFNRKALSDDDIFSLHYDLYKDLVPSNESIWLPDVVSGATAGLTGTATASITEADIVTGGKTIILTLTGDTFVAAGTGPIGSTADTQALIDGIDSAQAEATGWDAVVKVGIDIADVVRTSNTVATITLDPEASYNITAQETITATIPAAVLTGASPIVASPTFTVDIVSAGLNFMWRRRWN